VILVAVGEQHLVDAHRVGAPPVDGPERLEDLVGLAPVDQVDPVTLTHRVRLHERRSQAPQKVVDPVELHAIDGRVALVPRPCRSRNHALAV
jgi:hypothetical protein